ncbi:MAG: hypothetical protein JWP44_1128 [Mucilaginibacter sp.]|nr:hypothetical protein [Mucilaginibacter sp.]
MLTDCFFFRTLLTFPTFRHPQRINIFLHFNSNTIFKFASRMNSVIYRYTLLIIIPFCFSLKAFGQKEFTIHGVISRNLSGTRVAQVIITNLRSKDIMESDDVGWFSIKAEIGDTLLFNKKDYTPQKIAIINTGDLPVSMLPVITLNQVTIQGQSKRQELNEVMSDYRKQGTFYNGKPPVLSFLTSPVTGIYELFGKTPNRAKRFAEFSKGEQEYAEVHRRYNVAFVKRVTNTTDSAAVKFMKYYTPSIDDIKKWNDYELIEHTQKTYDFYNGSSNKEALENLNTPPPLVPKQKETGGKMPPPTVLEN